MTDRKARIKRALDDMIEQHAKRRARQERDEAIQKAAGIPGVWDAFHGRRYIESFAAPESQQLVDCGKAVQS